MSGPLFEVNMRTFDPKFVNQMKEQVRFTFHHRHEHEIIHDD
jgi:hypothetical protein